MSPNNDETKYLPSSELLVATSDPNSTFTAECGREGTRGGSRRFEADIRLTDDDDDEE